MGKITKTLFGEKPKAGKPMAGAKFQPFSYKSSIGSVSGRKVGEDGFTYDTTLSPELGDLSRFGQTSVQPLLSQYLEQSQAPIDRFSFSADPRAREAEIYAQQSALLEPGFEQQRQQLQSDLFGSGRMGLRLAGDTVGAGEGVGMVSPDAYGLGLAQSRALAGVGANSRNMAQQEQLQAYNQAANMYGLNRAAQQQQLQNVLGGYGQSFGAIQNVYDLESGLLASAAGREEARARAQAGSAAAGTPGTPGSGGLFGSIAGGLAAGAGAPIGAAFAAKYLKK